MCIYSTIYRFTKYRFRVYNILPVCVCVCVYCTCVMPHKLRDMYSSKPGLLGCGVGVWVCGVCVRRCVGVSA